MDTSSSSFELVPPPFPGFQPTPVQPAYYDSQLNGWQVFRYAEVQRVLSDYKTFSSAREGLDSGQAPAPNRNAGTAMLYMDPPRHQHYRGLVSQAFTPRTVAQLESHVVSITHALLDKVVAKGEMDVIDDFAHPLPFAVIAKMLGVPVEDQPQFKYWVDVSFELTSPAAQQGRLDMAAYFTRIIEQRCKEPQNDLISSLIAAQIEGQHLTQAELMSMCFLLIVAGNETVRNMLGSAILCFDEYPDAMEQVRADLTLLPGAIEEVLRWLPPVQMAPRIAAIDTIVDGQEVSMGQWLMPWIISANRDETQFPTANVFDVRRTPNRHLAFGHGVHFCFGAALARLEGKIALKIMLERFSDIKRVRTVPLEPVASSLICGVKHLPITFKQA